MGELTLTLTYVCLLVLLAWTWAGNRAGTGLKTTLLLLLPALYLAHWLALNEMRGWPVVAPLPPQFDLLAARIVEPGNDNNGRGSIHLWIRNRDSDRPRAHELPYSRALHEALHEARSRMARGIPQVGMLGGRERTGSGPLASQGQQLTFKDAPKTVLPAKP